MLSSNCFLIALCLQVAVAQLPVVVLHGVDSSAEDTTILSTWIKTEFNKSVVVNLELGDGRDTSLFVPMYTQLTMLCEEIYGRKELQSGFDFIGVSQGGLLARGYVERCNRYPVRNLITMVTPHGGTFWHNVSKFEAPLAIQGYWRDPRRVPEYLTDCDYLPTINNECINPVAKKQKTEIMTLERFVMVWSPHDTVLNPAESAAFSFLNPDGRITPINGTDIDNLLGLTYLRNLSRCDTFQTTCSHDEHIKPACFSQLEPIFRYVWNH